MYKLYISVLWVYILPLHWPCKIPEVYKLRECEGVYIIRRKTVFRQLLGCMRQQPDSLPRRKGKKEDKTQQQENLKANKSAAKILKEYLTVRDEVENFEEFDAVKLDETLERFSMDLRRDDGSHYKVNSLESIRHGLNRYLKSPPFNKKIDIVKEQKNRHCVKDSSFADGNTCTCFMAVLAGAKKDGKRKTCCTTLSSQMLT